MDPSIKRRLLAGLGVNGYGQAVTAVTQLLGVPILLFAWGSQLYGEWLILSAIPVYLAMSDVGFSQSVANDMTARVARGDRRGALAAFQSLTVLVCAIAAAGLLVTAFGIPLLPLQDVLHLQALGQNEAQLVVWLLAAQVFVGLLDGINHAGFRSSGDYPLHVGLYHTTRLVQFAGVWLVAISGAGLVAAAGVLLAVRIVGTGLSAWILVKRHQWLHFGVRHARTGAMRPLLAPAAANLAMPLAQALNIQGVILVVGAMLGPLAVVVFSTLRTLTRLALQLVLAVAHAAEPELARAYGAGNGALMRALFVHVLRASLWLALAAAVVLAAFGEQIVRVWTGGQVELLPMLFAWLLASSVASVLWYSALIVLKAANRHVRAAAVYVAASMVAVLLAALFLAAGGDLAYAGFALLITDIAVVMYVVRAAGELLDMRPAASFRLAVNPLPLLGLQRRRTLVP